MTSDPRERIKMCADQIQKRAYILRMKHFDESDLDFDFGPLDMIRRIEEYASEIIELSDELEADENDAS